MERTGFFPRAAGLAALPGLFGLCLVRMWAVLGGHLPGKILAPAALVLAGACVFAFLRFDLAGRYFLPFSAWWKNLLVFLPAFALGGMLDTSYAMFNGDGLLVAALPFRLLCHMGSGIFLGVIVLALVKAAWSWGLPEKVDGRVVLALALFLNILAAVYVAGSSTVYIWDTAGYWLNARTLAQAPLGLAQMQEVLASVITLDYNYLLAWPISLVMRLMGTGRYVFVLATVNLYLMPGVWGLCALSRRVGRGGGAMLVLGLPMLAYTALVGFVDVAAASAAVWVFVVYTDEKRPAGARGVLAGALLVLTFLLRRYFFFFAISFGAAALLKKLLTDRKHWVDWVSMLCSAAVCGVFFAQSFLVDKILHSNYGDIYSAYALGLWSDVRLFCRYFGWALLFFALVLGVAMLLRKGPARGEAVLALGQVVLCFLLFTRVQSHGQQHLLLYLPGLAALLVSGLAELPDWGWRTPVTWTMTAVMAVSPFLPRTQPAAISEIKIPDVLPAFSYRSPRRTDLMELLALRSYMDNLSQGGEKTAAVVASSLLFNGNTYENLLISLGIPEGDGPRTKLLYMADVDKRDGFAWNVLSANYLIVTDPVQTHLGEENQFLITLLARDLLDGTGPGAAFKPLKVGFTLEGGIKVYVYARTRDVTEEEYRSVSERLIEKYPDYAWLYQVPEEFLR